MPLNDMEIPRADRTPTDYANQIIDSVANSLIQLGLFADVETFINELLNPVVSESVQKNVTGDDMHAFLSEPGSWLSDGYSVDNRMGWALVACAFSFDAMGADRAGNVGVAWTFAMDARFAADALLSQLMDQRAASQARRELSAKAVLAKLANDPKQDAKIKAYAMWREWQSGKTLYKSGAEFSRQVVAALPIESTKTVERWMTAWRDSARK